MFTTNFKENAYSMEEESKSNQLLTLPEVLMKSQSTGYIILLF